MTASALLIRGDVRAGLRSLPTESVYCVVTSVPYWALRAYGTDPQVWGGDPDHAHAWGPMQPGKRSRWGDPSTLSAKQASHRGSAAMVEALEAPGGEFCECGAWRGELGLEPTVGLYVEHIVEVFAEVWRVLRKDGTVWLNVGDTYISDGGPVQPPTNTRNAVAAGQRKVAENRRGLKCKDMALIPQRLAIALQEWGWWVRSDVIWHKGNAMPSSVEDRPNVAHEYLWLLAKSERYYYDRHAILEPAASTRPSGNGYVRPEQLARGGRGSETPWELSETRNARTVWTINTQGYPGAHFATYPEELVRRCILAGTSEAGCCPSCGAPHERVVEVGEADREHQRACGADLNGEYHGTSAKHAPAKLPAGWNGNGGGHRGKDGRYPAPVQDPSEVKARILEGMREKRTVGWRPTCAASCPGHRLDPVPCVVADPFLGSGTTVAVAVRHGRRGVGTELNPAYMDLSRERVGAECGLFTGPVVVCDPTGAPVGT